MAYKREGSKIGTETLNNATVVIAIASGFGRKSLAVGHYGARINGVNVTGGTTTDTTVKFYAADRLIKTLTSASGTINDSGTVFLEQGGIDKITLTTTGNHTLPWALQYQAN